MNIVLSLVLFILPHVESIKYLPNWDSLDARPLPSWYDNAKIGIFLHWGVFSVPGFHEWFWNHWVNKYPDIVEHMKKYYPPDFTYADFGPMFRAEHFNPDELVEIFQAAGAKYVVLTSKHHEGYTMWPSKFSFNWNSMEVGPKRDLVGDLANSIRSKTNLHFGLYHSLYEWYNPLYLEDQKSGFKSKLFSLGKSIPELYEIVNAYKPDVVWSDGDWDAPAEYWNSTEFLAWLYNDSPVKNSVVINDRWGAGIMCKHGGFYTCADHFNPGVLQPHKWENCMTLDHSSWGHRKTATFKDYITIENLLHEVTSTISCGGNILINAGIRSDGKIDPIMEERYRQLGSWLKINGEAIYSSQPWKHQNDTKTPRVWYTSKKSGPDTIVYAAFHDWPDQNFLTLGAPTATKNTKVTMLGYPEEFLWTNLGNVPGIDIVIPNIPLKKLPSTWAWILKLTFVE